MGENGGAARLRLEILQYWRRTRAAESLGLLLGITTAAFCGVGYSETTGPGLQHSDLYLWKPSWAGGLRGGTPGGRGRARSHFTTHAEDLVTLQKALESTRI